MAHIQDFDKLHEDAKWLACKLLAQVDDKVWTSNEKLDITITINGVEIPDIDAFLGRIMDAFRNEVNEVAAEDVRTRFGEQEHGYQDAYANAQQVLAEHLKKIYGVEWNEEY